MTAKYRSSKLAKQKKKIRKWRIALVVVFIAVVLIGTSFWSRHDSMKISEIKFTELSYTNEDVLREIVFEELNRTYLGLLSKSNSLIFPRQKIKERILNDQPSIKSVDLDFKGFKKILLEVEEYEPVARFCEGDDCYLLNDEGYVFVKEPLINTNSFVTFRGNIEGDNLKNSFLDPKLFKSFIKVVEILNSDLDIEIVSVEESENPIFEFKSRTGAIFLIDKEDNMIDVIENIKTVFLKEGINREQFENIDYIDLRFGNKVFYRLK
ncbi:MAG: hypothetical protein ACI9GH_000195 [Candidatus Paceibacteria bacterium]|jgi:hypothetical protein